MSWDAWLEVDTGDSEPWYFRDLGNYTHNCNQMLREALKAVDHMILLGEDGLYALNNRKAGDVAFILTPALKWWRANREQMKQHEPSNGWGDRISAYTYWFNICSTCFAHSKTTFRLDG